MNLAPKWFILDLRFALAMYLVFIQFFSFTTYAQSSDPGSLAAQMRQRRIEQQVANQNAERQRGKDAATKAQGERTVQKRQAMLKMENGQQALVDQVTVENGKASYSILFGDKDFDLLVKKADGKKSAVPKEMPLKDIVANMEGIKDTFVGSAGFSVQDIANDKEWSDLLAGAQKYREYQEEMNKFESQPLFRKHIKQEEGIEYEKLSVKQIEQERQALQSKRLSQVIHEANMRFPKDTFMFFFAIGAVIAAELVAKNGGDPLAMQHHFDSLTDPIANLSFYTFILANGISLHYLKLGASKKLIDMNHRLIFASLPMISMPFASLVSNIVSDTAMTIKACTDDILDPKLAAKKKKEEDQVYTACDEAKRQWTLTNKSNQYIPQLLSLSVSNAPFIALGYAAQSVGKKLQVFAFMGAETTLIRIGGKVVMTGLKLLLSPVPAIALDMMVTNPLITRAWSTVSDDVRIENAKERLYERASQCVWQLQAGGSVPKNMPQACKDLKEDAIILRDRSQSWRATINSDFEVGFQSWTELMTKFNNQLSTAQHFYSYVFNLIMDYNHTKMMCDTFKVLKDCEFMEKVFGMQSFLLTKKYPLVAAKVNPKIFNSSEEGDSPEEYALKLKNAQSDFAANPLFTIAQIVNIHEQVGKFLANRFPQVLQPLEKEIFAVIVKKLQSDKLKEIVEGIQSFNKLYQQIETYVPMGPFRAALATLKLGMGEIRPVMNNGEGFLWARSFHSVFDEARTTTEYSKFSGKYLNYSFPTTAHYFMHEMLCGNSVAEWRHSIDFGRDIGKVGLAYTPPRLLRDPSKIAEFCEGVPPGPGKTIDYSLTFNNNHFAIDIDGWKFNPTQYLLKDYNFNLFTRFNEYGELYGTPTADGKFVVKPKNEYFGNYWVNANKSMLDKFLKEAREDWAQIYTELIMSFKNKGYVQDETKRDGIVKKSKGLMSDNLWEVAKKNFKTSLVPIAPIMALQLLMKQDEPYVYKGQPKNSLEVVLGETNIYFNLLKKLNIADSSKKTMRKMDAIIDYMNAQNQVIAYLQGIFEIPKDAKTDRQLESAMEMPDAEVIAKQQEILNAAMIQLKSMLIHNETEPILKSINTDLIYAIEGSGTDLVKYLMAANVIGLKDKEALRDMKEKAKRSKANPQLNSQGQGVRKHGK